MDSVFFYQELTLLPILCVKHDIKKNVRGKHMVASWTNTGNKDREHQETDTRHLATVKRKEGEKEEECWEATGVIAPVLTLKPGERK